MLFQVMNWGRRARAGAAIATLLVLAGCAGMQQDACPAKLSGAQISDGLRDLLNVALDRVVPQLGQTDAYFADKEIHIPLPEALRRTRPALNLLGGAPALNDLEFRFNRAAEVAVPRTRAAFDTAIANLAFDDPEGVFRSGAKGATRYFQQRMSKPLAQDLRPVVQQSLTDVGAMQSFDDLMNRYTGITLPQQFQGEIIEYVLEKALDGLFDYLGRQEGIIRGDANARTTDKLRCLFSRLT